MFHRQRDGKAIALGDECPHRKLRLSQGQLCYYTVICDYHCLTFYIYGTCVGAPTQRDNIPKLAKLKSYPVIDRYRPLWIWMGYPAKANPDEIFKIENFDNPEQDYKEEGKLPIECNYLWVVDNLLDLSHILGFM